MNPRAGCEDRVPLFLIARAVAEGVQVRGAKLYRISVVRTQGHQYRIKFKCRVKAVKVRGTVRRERFRAPGQGTLRDFDSRAEQED